ncbi:MAG: LPS assembly lipoprotein LptE [Gammaproteobacteria bacterium]|nr:LPS assembly lipoprotein LptE [Gammaproteobacteria bacterium]MDH5593872.1 LPS assembly lipoprotein LptE [Gammaproteobacteria bacterium]MDH5614874.1 LPS assembly lipoprotein LptE [Gammaproteobacteria bacterium]
MTSQISRIGFTLLLAVSILILEGCGFRMRGSVDVPVDMPTTFVQGADQYRGITPAIKRILRGSGVNLTEDPKQAELVLKIYDEKQTRRVLSVGASNAKVREYELNYQVDFGLERSGKALVDRQTISLMRDYTFDETAVNAKRNEENMLYKDMQSNAIRQLLQRVQIIMAKN